jgi:hypothetical protein
VASREVAEAREPTFADLHGEVVTNIERVIQGKPDVVALVVLCRFTHSASATRRIDTYPA